MGLEVILHTDPGVEHVTVDQRLALTEDDRLVPEEDPDARWLFCVPGTKIPKSDAIKYGLLKGAKRAEPADKAVGSSADKDATATSIEPVASAQAEAADDAVPTKVDDVIEWVGDDESRAQRAQDAELERAKPRTSLLNALEEIISTPDEPAAPADDGFVPVQ